MSFARARRLLDDVQTLAQLEAFAPAAVVAAARAEAPPAGTTLAELEAALDAVRAFLADVDRFAEKCMRVALHQIDVLPREPRALLAGTILAYAGDLALLRGRVAAILGRLDRAGAAKGTERILAMAEATLATRAELRQGILELARELAAAWLPAATKAARDRSQPDEERDRWARARVDLERLAARGETLEAGAFADRLAGIEPPAEEPEEEVDPAVKRFSLIEID
jgi:hypothetical protein